MEDSKILLLYLAGLAGLIAVSILLTGRIEPLEIEPLPPTATLTVTQVKSTASLLEVEQKVCSSTTQQMTAGYIVDVAHLDRNRVVISGTVYASDAATPLPGVQLKARRTARQSQDDSRFPPHYALQRTNEAGQYEFIIYKHHELRQLDYEVSYQDVCLLVLHLVFIDDPAPGDGSPASSPTSALTSMNPEMKLSSVLLRGPLDIVLPVPPPGP
jgi:hypothetical protein